LGIFALPLPAVRRRGKGVEDPIRESSDGSAGLAGAIADKSGRIAQVRDFSAAAPARRR